MSFAGARVLSFESRREQEMAELIRINGGDPFVAPALIEVPLTQNDAAFAFAEKLFAGEFDAIIFQTGIGARLLARVLGTRYDEEKFRQALRKITVVARGPKPSAVLREWSVPVAVIAQEPSTWREILAVMADRPEKRVAVQEYGRDSRELHEGLEAQDRQVTTVPVYQWQFPADTTPLAEAVRRLLSGQVDVTLFTTSVQLDHLLEFAGRTEQLEAVQDSLRKTFIASIGPTCSEALEHCGLKPDLEPSHLKMGVLVREAAIAFSGRKRV